MDRKIAKLERDMQRRISTLLFEVKDPTVQEGLVSVSKTSLSKDLKVLKVFVTVNQDEAGQQAVMESLHRAARFIRGRLGENLDLRYTPEVRFHLDDSPERAARIDSLLKSIPKAESADAGGGAPDEDAPTAEEDGGDEDKKDAGDDADAPGEPRDGQGA